MKKKKFAYLLAYHFKQQASFSRISSIDIKRTQQKEKNPHFIKFLKFCKEK